MATLLENANRIKTSKEGIKEKVNQDFTIINDEKIDEYPNLINNAINEYKEYIPRVREGTEIVVTDGTNRKILEFNLLGKSTQITTTGKNVFTSSSVTSKTLNGVEFIVNNDKTITANGTATADIDLYLRGNSTGYYILGLSEGDYIFSGCPSSGSETSYMLCAIKKRNSDLINYQDVGQGIAINDVKSGDAFQLFIRIFSGQTLKNVVFKPMIRLASITDATYEPPIGVTPNPDYPQEINSITGDVLLNITGKNLLKLKDGTYTSNGLTLTIENNILTLNGTNNGTESVFDAIKSSITVPTTSKTKIKAFQFDGTCANVSNSFFRSYVNWSNGINLNFTTSTIKNLNANLTYNNFIIGIESGTFNNYQFGILIADDLTDNTTYEPYQSNSITIGLQDNELCSIGDVKDELVIENGSAKIIKKIDKVILNGTESSWLENALVKGLFQITLTNIYGNQALKNAISDYLVGVEGNDAVNPTIYTNNSVSTYTSNRLFFRLNTYANNLNGLKEWLSTHNITVYYVLATPQEIELEGTYNIELSSGTNKITNSDSANMKVNYYKEWNI